jgi:hypothetical protein
MQGKDLGHIPIDPKAGTQGHSQLDHFLSFGDDDGLPFDPPNQCRCRQWLRYSPELNPVERLWEDLKRRIDVLETRLRSSLAALQAHVVGIIQRYTAETIASLTGYAYLMEAIYAL